MNLTAPPKPKILVAHPWMARGGSEATAMWSLQALQDIANVTFTTASPVDWDHLNATFGTRVSPHRVKLLPAPRLPGLSNGTRLAFWQRSYFERFCPTISRRFDVCISAYNPINFNQPAIQLIGDFSFCEKSRLVLYPNARTRLNHRPSLLRQAYLTVGDRIAGGKRPPLSKRGDQIVANSRWTAEILKNRFVLPDVPVLYPPSPLSRDSSPVQAERDPLGFVCLGRISPEKEIETVIEILDLVRVAGYPVKLDIVGGFGNDDYSTRIREMADQRKEWIRTPGFLAAVDKGRLFASRSFALHGARVEAFGIAVAEMAAAGLIPFVPNEGGAREIAASEDLIYQDTRDAAEKIISLLMDPVKAAALRASGSEYVRRFRPAEFSKGLIEIVAGFLGRPFPNT